MRTFAQSALTIASAAALLAGCGVLRQAQDDMRQSISALGVIPQSNAIAPSSSSSYQVLYSFAGAPDGQSPLAGLIEVNGTLYGTTSRGGKFHDGGTVFSITTSGAYHVLHSFGRRDGKPGGDRLKGSLIDVGGKLYATTQEGGMHRGGTVFSINTSGKERVLYSFDYNSRTDGLDPKAGLIKGRGTFYGTTVLGGKYHTGSGSGYYGYGTAFSLATGGAEKVLHSFGNGSDGDYPEAGLIEVNGTLYGTTYSGGGVYSRCGSARCASGPYGGCANGCGTVFSVTKAGKEKVLHRFSLSSGDGALPMASLIDVSGTLYGTTYWGGPMGEIGGTVFSISTSGAEKIVHNFGYGSDGMGPGASLIDVNGTLYGTTEGGGTYGDGTVFSISASGAEQVLHSFGGGSDGAYPFAGLIDVNGTLYGTTGGGGAYTGCYYGGCGTVFALTP